MIQLQQLDLPVSERMDTNQADSNYNNIYLQFPLTPLIHSNLIIS